MERIFISYAREDAEPFAHRLQRELTEAGHEVWWDRSSMQSRGRTFLQEIRDAVESVDRVLAIFTPAGLRSRYVRWEWDHALNFAKAVVPILRQGDWADVKESLGSLHGPDFRDPSEDAHTHALGELLRLLASPAPPLATFLTVVPSLPLRHQTRVQDLEHLEQHVLADIHRPVLVHEPTTVVHGMAGIGKSSLAAAFARRSATRRACADGIVWLNIGRDFVQEAAFSRLAEALGGQPIASSAADLLPRLLTGKRVLIVLDDVWNIGDLTVFRNALEPPNRLLVTSREALLPTDACVEVALIADEAALRFLADWSGEHVDQLPAAAVDVAAECGGLPFALALCGAMRLGGTPWEDLLSSLRKADLGFLEHRFPNYEQHATLLRSFSVSLDALQKEDPTLRDRYAQLAIFPESERISAELAARLWSGADAPSLPHARKALSRLAARSLLQAKGDATEPSFVLHSLQHDYLVLTTADLAARHARFLDTYRARGEWHLVADDGYICRRLGYHLVEAGRAAELHELLAASDDLGRHRWSELRSQAGDLAGAIDIARQASLASRRKAISECRGGGTLAERLALDARYALLITSIRSRAGRMPAELALALVRHGVLSKRLALAGARQSTSREDAFAILIALLEPTDGDALPELLAAADAIVFDHGRYRAWVRVGEWLGAAGKQGELEPVLARITGIEDVEERIASLCDLAPHVPESFVSAAAAQIEEWVREAYDLRDDPSLSELGRALHVRRLAVATRARLADHLPGERRAVAIGRLVAEARVTTDPIVRVTYLLALGENRPDDWPDWVDTDEEEGATTAQLSELVFWYEGEARRTLVRELVRRRLGSLSTPDIRSLVDWLARLTAAERRWCVEHAEELIDFEYSCARFLAQLVPRIADAWRGEVAQRAYALARTSVLKDGPRFSDEIIADLAAVASLLSKDSVAELRGWIDELDGCERAAALGRLSSGFEESARREVLDEAIRILPPATTSRDLKERRGLLALLGLLDRRQLVQVSASYARIGDTHDLVGAWMILWPFVAAADREWVADRALSWIESLSDWSSRAEALQHHAEPLATVRPERCLSLARSLPAGHELVALSLIARSLPAAEAERLVQEIEGRLSQVEDAAACLRIVDAILPHPRAARASLLQLARTRLQQIDHSKTRATRLVPLLPWWSGEEGKEQLSRCAEHLFNADLKPYQRLEGLRVLAPHTGEELAQWMLRKIQWSLDEQGGYELYCRIGARLAELGNRRVVEEILGAALPQAHFADGLEVLLPHLHGEDVARLLARAPHEIENPYDRERAACLLAGLLASHDPQAALDLATSFKNELHRSTALAAIVPVFVRQRRFDLVERALRSSFEIRLAAYRSAGRVLPQALISEHLADQPIGGELFERVIDGAAQADRAEVAWAIAAWAPVLLALGGEATMSGIMAAFRDATRWWPT